MFEVLQRCKEWCREVFVYTQVLTSLNKMEYVDNSNEDGEKVVLSEQHWESKKDIKKGVWEHWEEADSKMEA